MKEPAEKDYIICAGYAKLPEGTAAHRLYGSLGLGLAIDPVSGCITDVDVTFLTSMARRFIRSLLVGHPIRDAGIAELVEAIERRFHCVSKKALIAALQDAYKQYRNCLNQPRMVS